MQHPPLTVTNCYSYAQVWPRPSEVSSALNPGFAAAKLAECAAEHRGELSVVALGMMLN